MTNKLSDIENVRFKVSMPPWYDIDLELWAWIKGTDRAKLSSNVLQARVEANKDFIKNSLEEIARDQNVTVDELRKFILSQKGKADIYNED